MKTIKTTEIKVGKFDSNYPIKQLKHSIVNRDFVENHSNSFKSKVEEFGWLVPIVIDQYGNIIEGHHRVEMAIKIGMRTLPVYIVDWIDTNNKDEYLKYIISLNNANRKWTALDYLKSYGTNRTSKDYSFVYKKYMESNDVFSVGNVLNIYFNTGCSTSFKKGSSTIKDLAFSDYLFKEFYNMKKHYGGVKIQAFTINRVCAFAHQKIKGNLGEMMYIFAQLESLAETDSPVLSSVEHIRPYVNDQLSLYRKIKND